MRLLLLLGLIITLFISSLNIYAQCDPPDLLPTTLCELSPAICLAGACYSTNGPDDVGHMGFCGGMTIINNPQYLAFTAISSSVTIDIRVGICPSGTPNLQAAIVDTCTWINSDVLDCDAGTPSGGIINMVIPADSGSIYYLILDGFGGSICEYEILAATGVLAPPINGDLNSATTPDLVVCQGQDVFTANAAPNLPDAPKYSWSLPWGELVTSTNNFNISVPDDAPLGSHTVCVLAYSGCDTVDTQPCFNFTVVAVADEIKPPQTFCPEDIPFAWFGTTISGPGTYMQTFNNAAGCPYDSIWTVMVHPIVPVENIDTVHCGLSVDYEGVTYSADGIYDIFYPGQGQNGCDSAAKFEVFLVDLFADVEFTCENGEFILEATGLSYQPAIGTLTYQWFTNGGATLLTGETEPTLRVIDAGSYTVMVTVNVNGERCDFLLSPTVINPPQLVPPPPDLANGDTIICPNVLGNFIATNFDPEVSDFVWSADPTNNVTFTDDGSGFVEMDFSNASGPTDICVYAINDCGEGLPTCFIVELQQIPNVGIDAPNTVCVDSAAFIQFNGEASNFAVFTWNFGSGVIRSGPANGVGEGPYEVSWPTSGFKDVIVQVAEIGCDTVSETIQILVEEMQAPSVNCVFSIDEITFYWDPISGVDDYYLNIPGGGGMSVTSDTFITITGLNPNDTLTLFIFAEGLNTCRSAVVTAGCRTESCASPVIQIIGEDSICLNGAAPFYDLNALIGGVNTNGTWSGPGIVDITAGMFDPADATAGPGVHTILFTYIESPICTFTQNYVITVFDLLNSPFTVDPIICIDDASTITFTGTSFVGASYNWNFDNGVVISGTNQGPYEIEWANAGSKQVSLTVSRLGCVSSSTMLAVDVQPRLNSPIVNCIPNTTFVEFSWNNVVNSSGSSINVLQGPAGIQTGNNIRFDGLVSGDIVIIEMTTFSSNACPDLIDTFMCEARTCPMPMITIEPVDAICLDNNTTNVELVANVVNGNGTGTWSGNGIIDEVAGIFKPDAPNAGVGLHPIIYTYIDDGCTFINSIDIEIFETPSAIISNALFVLNCSNGNELILDGSTSFPAVGLSYDWMILSGGGQIVNGNGTALATINTAGTYQLKVTTPNGCVDSSQIIITQDAGSPTADAGIDRVLNCDISMVELGGASSNQPTIRYQWTTSDGMIGSDPTLDKIMVSKPGAYTIMVTDNANGCVSTDQVVVTIDTARAQLSIDIPALLDCDTKSLNLSGNVLNGIANFTSTWTATEGGNIESGATTLAPLINAPGLYTLEVRNLDNGCMSRLSREVFVDDDVITDIDVTKQDVFCFGSEDGSIDVQAVIGGTGPYVYTWSNGSSDTRIDELKAGIYSLMIRDANGCEYEESFEIVEPPRLSATLVANLTQYALDDQVNITLEINQDISTISNIIYQYGDESLCQNELTCSFTAFRSDSVSVFITDENGCTTEDKIFIKVILPRIVFIPNTFSPNDDGTNDFFNIFAKDIIANIDFMEIYSRWGEMVFYKENINANSTTDGWNGEVNGSTKVEPGVYVYRVKVSYLDGQESEIFKGDVTLLR